MRQFSNSEYRGHMGEDRDSNLWWYVWVGGLREGFMEEKVPPMRIIKAGKLR